jgi:hypothetical protein
MIHGAEPGPSAGHGPATPGVLDRLASLVVPRLCELGGPGTLLTPVVLVSVLSLLALAGIDPVLGSAVGGDEPVVTAMRSSVRLFAVLAPIFAMAKAVVLGGVAWSVLVLVGAMPRYRALVSAVLYGEVVLAFQGLWIGLVLQIRAAGGPMLRPDLHVPSGLDAFGVPSSPALAALVQGLSVFHLTWILVLGLAFAHGAATTRRKSAVAALAVWCLVVGLGVLRASLA